jgi:hypothetical protein
MSFTAAAARNDRQAPSAPSARNPSINYDHGCCREKLWPSVLADLAKAGL